MIIVFLFTGLITPGDTNEEIHLFCKSDSFLSKYFSVESLQENSCKYASLVVIVLVKIHTYNRFFELKIHVLKITYIVIATDRI